MLLIVAGVFLALLFPHGEAFIAMRSARAASAFQLRMGGGRSPAEKGMSKKQMFRAVRDKIFEAAKVPGFFDVGEGPPVSYCMCLQPYKYTITKYHTCVLGLNLVLQE